MGALPPSISVRHGCAMTTQARKGYIRSSGARVMDGCELVCGCWDLNLGLLEEQLLLLDDKLSLHPSSPALIVIL